MCDPSPSWSTKGDISTRLGAMVLHPKYLGRERILFIDNTILIMKKIFTFMKTVGLFIISREIPIEGLILCSLEIKLTSYLGSSIQ